MKNRRQREWIKESNISARFSMAIVFVFCLQSTIHVFWLGYFLLMPNSLAYSKPLCFGLRSLQVFQVGTILLVLWGICHGSLLGKSKWKIRHSISYAILVLSTIATAGYAFTIRKIEKHYVSEVIDAIERIDQMKTSDPDYYRIYLKDRKHLGELLDQYGKRSP